MMKALITQPDYGLVTIYGGSQWEFDGLALGGTWGSALVHNIQAGFEIRKAFPNSGHPGPLIVGHEGRDATFHAIIGDPTLRLHYLKRPGAIAYTPGATSLTWSASPEPGVTGYLIYRKNASTGLYERIQQCVPGPVTGTSATLSTSTTPPENSAPHHFMVRAVKPVTTGAGTYTTLSQGSFYPAQ